MFYNRLFYTRFFLRSGPGQSRIDTLFSHRTQAGHFAGLAGSFDGSLQQFSLVHGIARLHRAARQNALLGLLDVTLDHLKRGMAEYRGDLAVGRASTRQLDTAQMP